MPKKPKISTEEKISAVESYLRGELSQRQAAQKAGVKIAPFQRWLRIYRVEGPEGLLPHTTGRKYSSNQKLEAVKAYLSGEGSIGEICAKRGIWSDAQFGDWIKEYNAHGDFSSKKKSGGGSCMRQGRETTLEERIQIVKDCIASGKSYGEMAQKWLTDVTEFRWYEGVEAHKLYLSAILDLCDRRIVSYVLSEHNDNPLVYKTFDKAVRANPDAHPLFHSDRGYQYTSRAFHYKLQQAGMTQSMSRVGHCIDNGPMEGFWGILKRERYYGRRFTSKQELIQMVEGYIHYYNTRRVQRNLGILTPMEKHRLCFAA